MQNKFKLEFLNPKTNEIEEASVFTKSASNTVRMQLQKLEKALQVYTVKFSKELAEKYPDIFQLQQNNNGDLEKLLQAQKDLSVEQYEAVLSMNEELGAEQIRTLIEEVKVMIDIPKSKKNAKLTNWQVEQLESTPGKPITVIVDKDNSAKNIKYDFWNNQDLDVLGTEKDKFFLRTKL